MNLPYWKTFETENQEIYSCDMLRLSVEFGKNIGKVNKWFENKNETDFAFNIKNHKSYSAYSYRDMHSIQFPDKTSCMVAYGFQGIKEKQTQGVIEFNPNKLSKNPYFMEMWQTLMRMAYTIDVVRYDVAIDLPINRQYIKMPKQGNARYQTIDSGSYTETIGIHNSSGFTKVYDKSKESGLTFPCTRIEITLKRDDLIQEHMPKIYIKDYQIAFKEDNELSQNDKVFLRLLEDIENPDYYLHMMTSRKRNKMQEYMSRKEFKVNLQTASLLRFAVLDIEKTKEL